MHRGNLFSSLLLHHPHLKNVWPDKMSLNFGSASLLWPVTSWLHFLFKCADMDTFYLVILVLCLLNNITHVTAFLNGNTPYWKSMNLLNCRHYYWKCVPIGLLSSSMVSAPGSFVWLRKYILLWICVLSICIYFTLHDMTLVRRFYLKPPGFESEENIVSSRWEEKQHFWCII